MVKSFSQQYVVFKQIPINLQKKFFLKLLKYFIVNHAIKSGKIKDR